MWRISRVEGVIALLTFVITIAAAPALYWGVLAGVLMALSHFLYQNLHPRIIEAGLHPDGTLRDRHLWQLPPLAPHTLALRMDAALDFASAGAFERHVTEYLTEHPDTRQVCVLAQPINHIDVTGAEVFARVWAQLLQRDVTLRVSGLKLPAETVLRAAGLLAPDERLHLYRSDAELLAALDANRRAAEDNQNDSATR